MLYFIIIILYVTDWSKEGHQVVIFDEKWKRISQFGASILQGPIGIAITNDPFQIFVTDWNLRNITVFDSHGNLLRQYGSMVMEMDNLTNEFVGERWFTLCC